MRLRLLTNFNAPVYMLVLPMIAVMLTVTLTLDALSEPGILARGTQRAQQVGTFIMLSLMPPYLIGCMVVLMRQTRLVLNSISDLVAVDQAESVRYQMDHLHPGALAVITASVVFGLLQNSDMVSTIFSGGAFAAADLTLVIGNVVLWAVVGLVMSWRVPVSIALMRLGRVLNLDLYRLDRLRPLTNLATTDVLVIAGAMVLMPLQSLDAEFRWGNYEAGVIVGVPTAIGLFLLPLLGLRGNIRRAKHGRLRELTARVDKVDRGDIASLEVLSAHIERIRNIPDWPLDVGSLSKVFAYFVIPPLAWVGAALMENLVDRFSS
jgi:hypothetical protein